MSADRPPVGRGNVWIGPADGLPGEVIPDKMRRKLRRKLPDVNHPRRGLTWFHAKRGRRRLIIRTHVVTWEPLRLAWMVMQPTSAPPPKGIRGPMCRQLGVFSRVEQAIAFALSELGGELGAGL